MPTKKRDPWWTDRKLARLMGGEFVPPTQRIDTDFIHPLWFYHVHRNTELYVWLSNYFAKMNDRKNDLDRIPIVIVTREDLVHQRKSYVVLRMNDFRDLCVGTPRAGEHERENDRNSDPFDFLAPGVERLD